MGIQYNAGWTWANSRATPATMPAHRPFRFNGAHPLARNCVGLWVFNQMSLEVHDLRNLAAENGFVNGVASVSGTSIVPFSDRGVNYLDFTGDANADRISYGTIAATDKLSLNHTNEATFLWSGYNDGTGSTPSNFPHIACVGQGTGGAGSQSWRIYHDRNNNSINLRNGATDIGTSLNSFTEGNSQDRPYAVAIRRRQDDLVGWATLDGSTPGQFLTQIGTGSGYSTTNFTHASGDEFCLANWAGGSTDRNWEGKLHWVAIFDRGLEYTEVDYLLLRGGIQDLALGYNMVDLPINFFAAAAAAGGTGEGKVSGEISAILQPGLGSILSAAA